ncbi:MAG: PCRF domain-containing protein, partial [Bryobacterales bacterium]|nr:PCRF domain-containing protein [Bryobacterales bacterium]
MRYKQRLDELEQHFEELTGQMADPEIISNSEQYRKTAKQRNDLEDVVNRYREWKKVNADLEGARLMLDEPDAELKVMAEEDVARLEPELERIEQELKILLLPKDPNDDKNILLEIRAGTGGDEATLFCAEMFRMYSRWAEEKGWRVEVTAS